MRRSVGQEDCKDNNNMAARRRIDGERMAATSSADAPATGNPSHRSEARSEVAFDAEAEPVSA